MFGAEFVPRSLVLSPDKTGCIKDGGKQKILKGFPKETIELSEEHPKPADIK
jgi:hypothetical protein